ncbi:hypothetical protein Aph01nite_41850 [Acrocarpospora phusangensis]|uniref:Uncharacterized protein n=1 Tax=Acrocarpospora phusangensis TaxID=1070424 RepID=A0A919QEG4_9ACTN|nr:hypothetical protein [Acrocarpospora phusangensis]GIH25875.1 hypothetical protein Aph01nite_41850 [Acrocarpospora phusangensis]
MSAFFGSLLARAAAIALEALVAHLVQTLVQAALRRFAMQPGFAAA